MDLLGILVFVVFIFLSLAGKAAQEKERRRRELEGRPAAPRSPQWPGPVAGPGLPGFPRPDFPQRPLPPRPERAAPATEPRTGEGVSMEGVGSEGPQPGETAEVEVARFEQASQDVDREVENVRRGATRVATSDPATRQLGDLARETDVEWAEIADNVVTVRMEGALLSSDNLAQAVVMAEVMGRPKALRGRRWGIGVR